MYFVVKFLVRVYFRIMYSIRKEEKKNLPKDTAFILACNHRSYADPPLVGRFTPGRQTFMAKEELFEKKLFAWLISSLGAFPVSRGKGDTGAIDTAIANLESGKNLMIFPEGTRSKDGKVGRGHTGAALIAARSGKPVVPVGICYGEKLKFRTRITLKFGEPILPQDYVDSQEEPNPRQLVKLKNRYMADLKVLVEGEPAQETAPQQDEQNKEAADE